MTSSFSQTLLSTKTYAANFDEQKYFERTKRNHHWIGDSQAQKKIHDMRIGIAGLGGMGSNLAEIFVRLGVGHIKIADPDIIEASNLNRQVIANSKTIGQKKALASASELRSICEDFELVVYEKGITEENAKEFVSDLDVIIDEIDVFPLMAHLWLHKAAREKNLPIYTGYIIGLGTHVYKFHGTDYTLEDFFKNDMKQIETPSAKFIMDLFLNPPPSYLQQNGELSRFHQTIEDKSVPIFGASTYIGQSLLAIRVIADFLDLPSKWGVLKTPVMPRFLKLDPLSLTLDVHDMRELGPLQL